MPGCNLSSVCLSSSRQPGFLSWGLPVAFVCASLSETSRSPTHLSFLNMIIGQKMYLMYNKIGWKRCFDRNIAN